MKKLFVLFLVTALSISLFNSCGTAEERKDTPDTKDKSEPVFVLKLDDEKLPFDNVELNYDEMFGPQLTISAYIVPEAEEAGTVTLTQSFFSINIEDLKPGKMEKTNITLRDYNVINANAEVHKLEIGSGMYGARIDNIALDFSATLHDAEGKEYSLTGKYTK